MTVPGAVHVAVIVKLVPLELDTATEQLDAVPDVEKSDDATPLIDSEEVRRNCIARELESVGVASHETVGATVSMTTLVEAEDVDGPEFAFKSVTAFDASVAMTVPSVVQFVVTVNDVPLEASGEKVQVAVPALEKSALVRSEIDSLKERPNETVRFFVGVVGGVHDDTDGAVVSGIQRTITMPLPPLPPRKLVPSQKAPPPPPLPVFATPSPAGTSPSMSYPPPLPPMPEPPVPPAAPAPGHGELLRPPAPPPPPAYVICDPVIAETFPAPPPPAPAVDALPPAPPAPPPPPPHHAVVLMALSHVC